MLSPGPRKKRCRATTPNQAPCPMGPTLSGKGHYVMDVPGVPIEDAIASSMSVWVGPLPRGGGRVVGGSSKRGANMKQDGDRAKTPIGTFASPSVSLKDAAEM